MADPKELSEEELWSEIAASEDDASKPLPKDDPHAFAEKTESDNDTPSEEAAAEVAAADQTEAPDIWANAPPDLKAAHDAQIKALESASTEHARRSIEGRIAAYTRRLHERNEAAAQQPKPQEEEAADPLAELAAEYPEIATPFGKKLAPLEEKIQRFEVLEQSRQAAADAQMDAELKANESLLERQHPGWDKYLKQYGAAFKEWIDDQPLYYRQAFETNKAAIIDPYSAIDTLAAFKSFVAQNTQPSPQATPNGRPAAAPTQGLNPRRAAQLAGTATPSSVGSRPTVSGIPQDGNEEQLWNAFRDIDPDERKYRSA